MALDDRDWYREKPSEAWRKLFPRGKGVRGGDEQTTVGGNWGSYDRPAGMQVHTKPRRRRRRRSLTGWMASLALAAAVGAGLAAWQDHDLPWQRPTDPAQALPAVPKTKSPARPVPQTDASVESGKVIRFRPRPGLDTPAKQVSQWSITDPRFGRVSVYVPVGTTPREALTRALAEKGYQVLP